MTGKHTKTPYSHGKLVEALELITRGSLDEMKLWLLVHEPSQPNEHEPLVNCNRAVLNALIAKRTLVEVGK